MSSFLIGFVSCWLIGSICMMRGIHKSVVSTKFPVQKDEFPFILLTVALWPLVLMRSLA